jgi:hypothetical protein
VSARVRWILVVVAAALVVAFHLRLARRGAHQRREPAIAASANARAIAVRIAPEERIDQVELEIRYADDARSPTELVLPFGSGHLFGVDLHDLRGNLLPIKAEGYADHARLVFELPADRQVVVGFQIEPVSTKTFGWGHRAVANDWVPNLTEARIPVSVQIEVPNGTTAPGFRCSTGPARPELAGPAPRVCSIPIRSRRTLALPVAPEDDALSRIVFAATIAAVISTLMYAIYRRWSDLAYAMGARDEDLAKGPVTMDELAVEYRRARAKAKPDAEEPEVDPLEAVALVARGITSVLSVIGSLFLVSHFYGGLFPIPAPIALSLFAAVGGGIVIVATGIDRARPMLGIALTIAVGLIALHPLARWVVPGLLPVSAGVLMQLTAKR